MEYNAFSCIASEKNYFHLKNKNSFILKTKNSFRNETKCILKVLSWH